MVSCVYVTGLPSRVIPLKGPTADWAGTITCKPLAPAPMETVKESVSVFQLSDSKAEPLRPSSQVNIWRPETTGTLLLWAAAMMASEPGELKISECILAVKAP